MYGKMHGCLCNNQQYMGNITENWLLFNNIHAGIGEIVGMGYHVDNMQTMQTVELQLMSSHGSRTK